MGGECVGEGGILVGGMDGGGEGVGKEVFQCVSTGCCEGGFGGGGMGEMMGGGLEGWYRGGGLVGLVEVECEGDEQGFD